MDNLIPAGAAGYSICGHSNCMSCYGNTGVVSPAAGFYLWSVILHFSCGVPLVFYNNFGFKEGFCLFVSFS